jgi:hypothetical protein
MPRSTRSKLLVVAVALGFWACGSNTTTTPTTPTTPQTTTETFDGTLNPNGAKTFPFTVLAAGTVTATLTTVSPDATVAVGLALGTWNGTACQIVLANDNAIQGAVVIGSASTAGNLCTRVYDVGNLTDVASFVVTVEHP